MCLNVSDFHCTVLEGEAEAFEINKYLCDLED